MSVIKNFRHALKFQRFVLRHLCECSRIRRMIMDIDPHSREAQIPSIKIHQAIMIHHF